METTVGIDSLSLYASTQRVDMREIAERRGISEKDLRNVRFESRSVPPLFEDPVTLAVNAARPLLDEATRADVELLIVATETGVDFGKPLSTYVQDALGVGPRCRNFEIKHACFGGTAALLAAVAHIRGARPGKKALVVMTDIARVHVGDTAEITAGAGAVALLVSREPRLAGVFPLSGRASKEVFDVARPTAVSEWNDPVLSLYSYLDLVEGAWEDYREQLGVRSVEGHFRHMLYHAPLTSLIERAHRVVLDSGDDDVDSDVAAESFARMVAPSLGYNRQVGNIYSGSLYASLAGLIDDGAPSLAGGERVGCFSYGSGACSELFALEIAPTARATMARRGTAAHLRERRRLDLDDYERQIRELQRVSTLGDFVPDVAAHGSLYAEHYEGRGRLVLDGVANHHRKYRWT